MNKRQKKKQLAVQYRKAYKGLRKYCLRHGLTKPPHNCHLPKFQEWKEGITIQIWYDFLINL